MWILKLQKPGSKEDFLIHWDKAGRAPVKGATFMTPKDFETYALGQGVSPAVLAEALKNVKDRGTSHGFQTAEMWLSGSYRKEPGGQGGPYTVKELFAKFSGESTEKKGKGGKG